MSFKVDDIIEWNAGKRSYRGKIVKVHTFNLCDVVMYDVRIIRKKDLQLSNNTVTVKSHHNPRICEDENRVQGVPRFDSRRRRDSFDKRDIK
tara:strand:+ start:430 stop:705 length:276 start_codon:yes stop_codon:yes gene_type:complete